MKKHSLKVSLSETRSRGSVKRTVKFDDKEIWWDISGDDSILPPRLTVHDIAATGLVFFAMHHGKHLHIDGPVSASLLENLEDLVVSWVNWRPDLYQRISISAAEEVRTPYDPSSFVISGQAVAAFSGGLDASFTAWRHVSGKVGRRNKKLIAGVLIHGFDIPLDAHQAFETTYKTAAESLRSLGVPLAVIKTNWRAQTSMNWNLEFGAGVSTCLRHWQGMAGTALLGSDDDYRLITLPWGGNPIVYAMLSSSDFKVVCDGAEFSRTEKAEGITDWPTGLRNLRVCWQGPLTGKNCGICEKCLRTKMNFLAVGAPLPESLSCPPTVWQILRIRTRRVSQLPPLKEIIEMGSERKIAGIWLAALKVSLLKNKLSMRFSSLVHLNELKSRFRKLYKKRNRNVQIDKS
ncbi:hypothetical protein [Nitrosospira briensis]|uniref:hypothetical protein n=1 Tax=Nitrosospira briensis TaxID=35799 RepID=UPI000468C7DF|nr:hypothetical protein [Nitrosospira briensis]